MNIYLDGSNIHAGAWKSSSGSWPSTATTADEWHHAALVFEDKNLSGSPVSRFYHDGVEVGTFNNVGKNSHGDPSALGASTRGTRMHDTTFGSSGGGYFDGIIDEFKVTNSSLSAEFINALYNSEKNGTWQPSLNEPVNHFTCEGVCLSESLVLTDTATGYRNLIENPSFTDTVTKSTTKLLTETL